MIKFRKKSLSFFTFLLLLANSHAETTLIKLEKDNPYSWKRYNIETNATEDISIYDDENISSYQYGANQYDFLERAKYLLRDPLIRNELNKIKSEDSFDTEELANFYYTKYLEAISINGCGYAASVNRIFKLFEGKEEEFTNIFGFPPYTIREYVNKETGEITGGYIDFNYEVLMLMLWNANNTLKNVEKTFAKEYLSELQSYLEEEINKANNDKDLEKRLKDVKNALRSAKNTDINLGIMYDKNFGDFKKFLSNSPYDFEITINKKETNYEDNDIVSLSNFTIYLLDENDEIVMPVDNKKSHYISIVKQLEDGNYVASSWGLKFLLVPKKQYQPILVRIKEK